MVTSTHTYIKANRFTKFFWNACGAEIEVLENCCNNDRVKYFCLGGIVLATGLMAGFAGGYAFYTIFQPKSYVLTEKVHAFTSVMAIVFGIFWGFMIFNLDRYIVASSGIGDGTEKITWPEFTRALPRLIMGVVIAITISKPVEIRIFKTEIDNALYQEQLAEKAKFTGEVNKRNASRRTLLDSELDIYNRRIEQLNNLVIQKTEEAEKERILRGGRGPETNRLETEAATLRAEKTEYIATNASRIQTVKNQIEAINSDVRHEISKGDKVASQLDGLLQRIKLSHKIAGWPITIFITLLFIVIELTPIFFKMMVNKSNYDIMLDEYKKNNLILSGYLPDSQNPSGKNPLREESMRQLGKKVSLQKELFDKIYDKFKTELLAQADKDYSRFVATKDIKIDMMPGMGTHTAGQTGPTEMHAANIRTKQHGDVAYETEIRADAQPMPVNTANTGKAGMAPIDARHENPDDSNRHEPDQISTQQADVLQQNKHAMIENSGTNDLNYTGPDFEEK